MNKLDIRSAAGRVITLLIIALALVSIPLVASSGIGTTLALQTNSIEVAQLATRLAPGDPQTHFALGKLRASGLQPEDANATVQAFERAVGCSPYDYRYWLVLGSARERAGDPAGGEHALRESMRLAPNYAIPKWTLGNLLLRQNRTDEAFSELSAAAVLMPSLRVPVLSMATQVYNGNPAALVNLCAGKGDLGAALVTYLLDKQQPDLAFGVWTSLTLDQRKEMPGAANQLIASLVNAHKYRAALEVASDERTADAEPLRAAQLLNASFESDVEPLEKAVFGWRVAAGTQPSIAIDIANKHSGGRSLVFGYNTLDPREQRTVSQLVVLQSGMKYRLRFDTRSADLKGMSTSQVAIVDAGDGREFAVSAPVAQGTNDWTEVTLDFALPQGVEGALVVIRRVQCAADACALFGRVWYDDFTIESIGPQTAG